MITVQYVDVYTMVGINAIITVGLQGDPTSPFWRRSALGFLWKEDAKDETPVLWPPHAKSWLIGKVSDAGRDWGQEEKGTTGDEMAGWHHRLDGRESEWTPGVCDRQGGLACCDSRGRRVWHDWATKLNWRLSREVEKRHTGGDTRGVVPVTPSTSPTNAVTVDPGIECGYHTV